MDNFKLIIYILTALIMSMCTQQKPIADVGAKGGLKKIITKNSERTTIVMFNVFIDTNVVHYNLKLDTAYLIITTDTIK